MDTEDQVIESEEQQPEVEAVEPEQEEVEEVEEAEEVVEEPEEQEEAPEPEEVEEPQPSRREQLRVQQLLEKYGTPNNPRGQAPKAQDALDYQQALDADPEVIAKFEADRQYVSDQAYQQGLRESQLREWQRDLKYELPTARQKFKFLDPDDKANYSETKEKVLNDKYLRFVGFKPATETEPASVMFPDVSYVDFIEAEMEFAEELANEKIARSTKNIAKQAAQTGLRPDGSKAKRLNLDKAPHEMTDEELDLRIKRDLGLK